MIQRNYQIHDLLSFQLNHSTNALEQWVDSTQMQFSSFEVPSLQGQPDLIMDIGAFTPSSRPVRILDNNYRVAKDYLSLKAVRKFAKWHLEIENLNEKPHVRIDTNLAGQLTRPLNLAEYMIQYCLLQKRASVIHSAAVVRDERVLLLPGTGGTGKTTLSLVLMDRGYQYMGDNFIILKDGEAMSYLSPFNIFYYNRTPLVEPALTVADKSSLFAKKMLYDFTRGYIKILQKVDPIKVLGDKLCHRGRATHLCFLEPNDRYNGKVGDIEPASREEIVKKLRLNMEIEWHFFNKYSPSFGYMYPDSLLGDIWTKCEEAIYDNLEGIEHFATLGVPTLYTSHHKERIGDMLHEFHDTSLSRSTSTQHAQ